MNSSSFSIFLFFLAFTLSWTSCKKEEVDPRSEYIRPIDPSTEPDRLCRHLGINGSNLDGTMPIPTNNQAVRIINAQSSALVSKGATLYIPFTFVNDNPLGGIYLQVVGAENYWEIPFATLPSGDSYVFPVNIPDYVLVGNFGMIYSLYDDNGNVSTPSNLLTKVAPVEAACTGGSGYHESGSEGLTVRRIELGDEAGTINIRYQMYSLPDRLDIEYDGEWVASTAPTPLSQGATPPSSVCFDGTEGYVSGSRVLSFEYDPQVSKEFLIYMYGCYGATAWDFWVDCPSSGADDCPVDVPFPQLTPVELTMPANHEGQFNTGIILQDGDYVFVDTRGSVHLQLGQFPYTDPRGTDFGDASLRKYPNYRFGQMLIKQGGRTFPAEPINLKGDDCEGIADEFTAGLILGGIFGDYFVARSNGQLTLELNDLRADNNEGQFKIKIYVLSMSQHQFRNCFNRCPRAEPEFRFTSAEFIDTEGNEWDELGIYDETIEECYHGGEEDYRGERAPVQGCQCVYSDQSGAFINSDANLSLGTFDYGYLVGGSAALHFILDVLPHIIYLQEDPNFRYLPTPESNLY